MSKLFHQLSKKERARLALFFRENEYLIDGILKSARAVRNKSYCTFLSLYKWKLKRELKDYNNSKSLFTTLLKTTLGDFSLYQCDDSLKSDIISQANNICAHRFRILGAEIVFKSDINWHQDFKSGFEWPKGKFFLNYIQVDLSNDADVKIPRELSRCHHLVILGQAYLISKDEKYAQEIISQILHWIEENPLMYSINWGCAMDVAIRAVNWLFALNMVIDSKFVDQAFLNKIIESLYQHGWFIDKNLERGFKFRANHHDGNIGGLLPLGLVFYSIHRGERWFAYSKYALFNEIRSQIYPSGMEWEKASFYNRLVLEIFSYSVFLLKRNGYSIPADIEFRIWSMYTFVDDIAFNNGELPILGDQDNARFIPFDRIYRNDINYIRDIACFYYGDDSFNFKLPIKSSDVFFLLGADNNLSCHALQKRQSDDKKRSKNFLDVGICKLVSENITVIINNSSPGKYVDNIFAVGSHAHADLLSFLLEYQGIPILIDPGTYTYTGNFSMRNKFRSTSMHNTITVDGLSQFKFREHDLFRYETQVEVSNIVFSCGKYQHIYQAQHNAYSHLEKQLTHSRKFILNNLKNSLTIIDILESSHNHKVDANYHFHPSIELKEQSSQINLIYKNEKIAEITFTSDSNFEKSINQSEYSPSYGELLENLVLKISFNGMRQLIFSTEFKFVV